MLGESRGGMMTYIACRKDSRIKAAAVLAGLSDFVSGHYDREQGMKDVEIELIGSTPEELPEEYSERSAINWADEIDVPLLIIHGGESDWRVKTQQSLDMAEALEKHDKEYKLIIYEEADHSLQETNAYHDVFEWFDNHPLDQESNNLDIQE